MSSGTQVQPRQQASPPIVKLRADLLGALERNKERAKGILDNRHVLIACQQIEANPALLRCSPASIFREIFKAGLYGWVCDGILGQGYLVPFGGEATLIAGYKGLRDLVRRSGQADTVMDAVRDGDTFEYRGIFQEPVFVKSTARDRMDKPVVGAFVIVHYAMTKSVKTFWWPIGEILAHRDRYSVGWKKRGGPDKLDHPWHEKNPAFAVMAMKTVLRAVINRGEAPVSLQDRNVIREPDEDGAIEVEASGGMLSDQPLVTEDEDQPQLTGLEPAKPGQVNGAPPEPSVDPRTADEVAMASDAREREYLTDVLPHCTELNQITSEVLKRAKADLDDKRLTADAHARIVAAAQSRAAEIRGKRGERSNKAKSLPGVDG